MIVPRKAVKPVVEIPKIKEEKIIEKINEPLTEEESIQETELENQSKFFDEDDEIIEVNFD